jgi:hypothetical protein
MMKAFNILSTIEGLIHYLLHLLRYLKAVGRIDTRYSIEAVVEFVAIF